VVAVVAQQEKRRVATLTVAQVVLVVAEKVVVMPMVQALLEPQIPAEVAVAAPTRQVPVQQVVLG
jgi:hypothetical protein